MPKKKSSGTKVALTKKKPAKRTTTRKAIPKARGKTGSKKTTAGKKLRRAVKKRVPTPVAEIRSPEASTLDGGIFSASESHRRQRGMGPASAGQSGDLQGLSRNVDVDSESVEELAAGGQPYEAEVVSGVEEALDTDPSEVRTREVLADDVPEEYTDKD